MMEEVRKDGFYIAVLNSNHKIKVKSKNGKLYHKFNHFHKGTRKEPYLQGRWFRILPQVVKEVLIDTYSKNEMS